MSLEAWLEELELGMKQFSHSGKPLMISKNVLFHRGIELEAVYIFVCACAHARAHTRTRVHMRKGTLE